jgi:hypothetical protein
MVHKELHPLVDGNVAKKLTFYPKYKVLFWANPTQDIVKYHIFSSMVVAASCYGYPCHRQGLGSFLNDNNKLNRVKHRQNPRGKLGSVCFPTDLGRQIHLSSRTI